MSIQWFYVALILLQLTINAENPYVVTRRTRTRQTVGQLQESIAHQCGCALQHLAETISRLSRLSVQTRDALQEIGTLADMQRELIRLVRQLAEGDGECPLSRCDKQRLVDAEHSFKLFEDSVNTYAAGDLRNSCKKHQAAKLQQQLCAILQQVQEQLPKVKHGKLQ